MGLRGRLTDAEIQAIASAGGSGGLWETLATWDESGVNLPSYDVEFEAKNFLQFVFYTDNAVNRMGFNDDVGSNYDWVYYDSNDAKVVGPNQTYIKNNGDAVRNVVFGSINNWIDHAKGVVTQTSTLEYLGYYHSRGGWYNLTEQITKLNFIPQSVNFTGDLRGIVIGHD